MNKDEAEGRVKEAAGDLTGNKDMQREGNRPGGRHTQGRGRLRRRQGEGRHPQGLVADASILGAPTVALLMSGSLQVDDLVTPRRAPVYDA